MRYLHVEAGVTKIQLYSDWMYYAYKHWLQGTQKLTQKGIVKNLSLDTTNHIVLP